MKENGQLSSYLSFNDGTYSVDYLEHTFGSTTDNDTMTPSILASALSDQLVGAIQQYEEDHQCKILGAGILKHVIDLSPSLPSRLWAEMDILPFSFDRGLEAPLAKNLHIDLTVDEEADSMARKCLMYV